MLSVCQRRKGAGIEWYIWGRATVVEHAYSFLSRSPLSNVPGRNVEVVTSICSPFRGYPHMAVSRDSGVRPRLCSSEAVTSRTRHSERRSPARPATSPATPSSLYHSSRSDPPSPGNVPHSNSPCHRSLSSSAFSSSETEWCPRIAQLAAASRPRQARRPEPNSVLIFPLHNSTLYTIECFHLPTRNTPHCVMRQRCLRPCAWRTTAKRRPKSK